MIILKKNIDNLVKNIAQKLKDFDYVEKVINKKSNYRNINGLKINPYDEMALSSGLPSLCMLYGEMNEQYPKEDWDIIDHQYIKILGETITKNGIEELSMFSGAAGIGLSIVCSSKQRERYTSFISNINEFIKSNIKEFMDKIKANTYCNITNYDVISGVSGIASYCMLFPQDEGMTDILKEIVTYIIDICRDKNIENISVPGWYIPSENLFTKNDKQQWPKGCFNIGLAHGIPGILIILCNALKLGICLDGQSDCIRKIGDFLIRFRRQDNNGCYWGCIVSLDEYIDNTIDDPYFRDAWCYGTPGVAYSLLLAGKVLNNQSYITIAIEGMQSSIKRLKEICSPTFCHGLSGEMYIAYRFYELTNLAEFKDAYIELSNKLISFYDDEAPFGFYDIEIANGKCENYNYIGLIDGTVGILLTLMAIQNGKKTPWDCAFLLSDI
ncbi:lanthionine synthetase C family protein [Clostridium estertheticum]|uniref:lanthionine synthetase C family protein n=1 Tax=Clostridium estertheticum TaxID=238834 RepID=UPI0022DD75F8|nr:lanthionine synthetase C family protein [Clostridium estertheticum]WBL49589.1 lanthionine synthetase C family protein [Clostridium estertheticum]